MRMMLRISMFTSLAAMSALPLFAVAEEGRPWGRLNKPPIVAPESQKDDGYLGRYNPWGQRSGDTKQAPRYQKRERKREGRKVNPYAQPYGADAYGYYPQPPLPYSGMAPWGGVGGFAPDYGNYWNDPYMNLSPDTGLLWSDMWRW